MSTYEEMGNFIVGQEVLFLDQYWKIRKQNTIKSK